MRLAKFNIAGDLEAGTLVPLLDSYREKSDDMIYVLCPRGRVLAPRAKMFLQFLREHFAVESHTTGIE